MRNLLKILVFGAAMAAAGAASAQEFNVRIGIGDDRPNRIERRMHRVMDDDRDVLVERRRIERRRDVDVVGAIAPVVSRRIVERRVVEPRRVRTVCTTTVRERVRPSGVIVRRPTEVCRQVVTSRRVRAY